MVSAFSMGAMSMPTPASCGSFLGSITSMERMVSAFCSPRPVCMVKRACSYTPLRKESPVAV